MRRPAREAADESSDTRQREPSAEAGRGLALVATSLGFGVVQLDVSVVNVAIKSIGTDLGGSVSGLQWVVNAYTVAFAALILSAGALGDRIGAKRVFLFGFALFTVASVGCGLAPNLAVLVAVRVVQGIGAAILVPCSLTLLNHAYPDGAERARAVGLWAAGASVALSAGPLVGGLLTASLGWRAIFFINVPIGLVGMALAARYASETTRSADRGVDPPGQAAAIVALLSLAASTVLGGQRGFASPEVLAGFAVTAVAAAMFVLIEARRDKPMLPLTLFASRTFAAATSIGLVVNIAFYGLIFVFSLYFQTSHGYTALATGLAFAPSTVAVLIGNLSAGRAAARFGTRQVVGSGALIMAVALAGLLTIGATTPYPAVVAQLFILGLGLGLVVPAMTSALLGSVDASRSGIASGTLNTARQAGSVIGVALFGSLIGSAATSNSTTSAADAQLVSGLRLDLAISIALALAAAAICATIKKETE